MALITVQKNGTTMQIDSANLGIWTGAGWTQAGGSTSPAPQQSQPAPQPVQQQSYTPSYAPAPTQSAPSGPQGNVDLNKYGVNPNTSPNTSQLAALNGDYDNLTPIYQVINGSYQVVGYNGTQIPKATVIGPNGDRVTVRTDNATGKYRTLQEMLGQGYKQEGNTPGVSGDQTIVAGGAQVLSQRPDLKLKDGSTISSSDPNYDKYAQIPGVTTVPGTGGPQAIPFKAGLNTSQQQSISTLIANKPDSSTWSGTDKTNWNYATNNAPLPSQTTNYSGTGSTGGGSAAPSGGTGATGAAASAAAANINPQDAQWVNAMYQKYFDRVATSSELANWAKENPQALEQFLQADAKKYGYTSKYFQDNNTKSLTDALGIIDNSDLPPAIKDLWKTVVKGYPQGVEYNASEILSTFQKVKDQTIDPHFKELANIAMNDFKTAAGNLTVNRSSELEQERAAAGQNIRQAREGLEKSGMTFSGKGIEELGGGAAYAQPGATSGNALPEQAPFGGMFFEGNVNQANRLMASSSSSRYNQTLQSLGSAAEKQLGSAGAAGLGLSGGIGGVTGDLETQKQGQYGSTLNQIIDNYRQKQNLNTNQ